MAARFADIKFNLLHTIELLGDMNHLDMDVSAPPSDHTFYKETEVAQRLNIFLGQLIEEGVFNDCELRDEDTSVEDELDEKNGGDSQADGESISPKSEGFGYTLDELDDSNESEESSSRQSLTNRFKRYIRRIIPKRQSETLKQEKRASSKHLDGALENSIAASNS